MFKGSGAENLLLPYVICDTNSTILDTVGNGCVSGCTNPTNKGELKEEPLHWYLDRADQKNPVAFLAFCFVFKVGYPLPKVLRNLKAQLGFSREFGIGFW